MPGPGTFAALVKMAALQGATPETTRWRHRRVQLLADSQQGDAWTRAILGLCCPEIHLCGAALVQEQLLRMIQDCGDDYVLKHTPVPCPDGGKRPRQAFRRGGRGRFGGLLQAEVLSLSGL